MIYLGKFIAGGDPVKYRANFHSDQGTIEDPATPEAQLEKPDNTFIILTTPAKINAKTGHFGGSVPTTGLPVGRYLIRMAGTVSTAKVIATEFAFDIEDPADYKADISTLATAASIAALANFNPSSDVLENGETYDEILRIIRASAAGLLTRTGDVLEFKSADGLTTRITATVDANNNRILVVTNGA